MPLTGGSLLPMLSFPYYLRMKGWHMAAGRNHIPPICRSREDIYHARSASLRQCLALALLLVVFSRCRTTVPMTSSTTTVFNDLSTIVDTNATGMLNCTRKAIEQGAVPGGLASDDGGELITGWVTRTGKRSGILFWEKRWQERRRFILRVFSPPSDTDTRTTILAIDFDADERPNESYPWERVENYDNARTEAIAVLHRIRLRCAN